MTQATTGAQTNPTAAEGMRSSSAAAPARRRRWRVETLLQLMADSSLQLATADSPATRSGEWVKMGS